MDTFFIFNQEFSCNNYYIRGRESHKKETRKEMECLDQLCKTQENFLLYNQLLNHDTKVFV